jgi:ribosome biogenesis SPOUT family RNA methylase Rps3
MIYVIENLEDEIGEWSYLEYNHMAEIAGPCNVLVTNISEKEAARLPKGMQHTEKSASELGLTKVAFLEQEATEVFKTSDKEVFDYLLFGGILGKWSTFKLCSCQ